MDAARPLRALSRAQSSLIRQLLRDKKVRIQEGAFVVEGAKLCSDLVQRYPHAIRSLTLSSGYLRVEHEAARRLRSRLGAPQFTCSDTVFETLSDVEAPQGVLAVARQPQWDEAQVLAKTRLLGIYGDRLRDPANVGAIIRTAAALNLTGVWLSPDSADPFGSKVVRAAAGALLSLPIFRSSNVGALVRNHCAIYAAVVPSSDAIPLKNIRTIPRRLVIAVGNEGDGLMEDVVQRSDIRFFIPLAREVESLNVAATVAIAAFCLRDLPAES